MSITQDQYQTILYRLTKIEAGLDFIQSRIGNNNSQSNINNSQSNINNSTNTNENIFSRQDPFSSNLNNQNLRTTSFSPTNISRSAPNQSSRISGLSNLNGLFRDLRNTPVRRNLTPNTVEISMLSPSSNILNSLFSNLSNSEESTIAPSHRIVSNNTELGIYNSETNTENSEESESQVCAICQENIDNNSIIRKIKKCGHIFHSECLDKWLEDHLTCPSCRQDIRINE